MQRATKDKDNYRDNNRSSNSGSSYNNNNHNNSEAINQQQYQYQHQYHLQHQKTEGFLGSFLSKGLKTNQLVVNTDEKTLRPIARLKEPRDLFALPKDKDNDCSQQAPRWPVECQVIEERITHIPYVPAQPEPLNMPTGNELKPRPVGEENGIVVFSYNPISAVNYEKPKAKKNDDSSDESDYSSDSHIDSTPPSRSTPVRQQAVGKQPPTVSKMINNLDNRSTSVSLDEDNDFEDDYDYDTSGGTNSGEAREKAIIKDLIEAKKKRYAAGGSKCTSKCSSKAESSKDPSSEIDDIWKNNSTEYKPASPRYVLSQFGRKVSKAIIEKMCDSDDKPPNSTGGSGCSANKVPKSKYAVAPIKLPKSNIARLEQAFQRSASTARTMFQNASIDISDDDEDDDSTSTTLDDTDEMDEQSERKDRGRGGAGGGNIEAHPLRLTGGAEKRQCNGSTSVSETDTLVGDESLSRLLATKQDVNAFHSNALPPGIIHRARPHTHEATMAAAAAVARGRNRDIESIYYAISAPSSSNSNALSSTTTSTTASTTNSTYSNISTSTNNNNNYWLGKNEAMHPLECPDTTINNNNSISGINQATTMTTPPSSQSVSSAIPPQSQFSRSAVGGAKFVTNCHPMNPDEYDGLEFESRFESGNLAKAVQITPTYYELYLRPDLYTSRSKQWFYFRVRRTHRKMLYRFSIVNLVKSDSLYNDGMQPVMYSTLGAKEKNEGWRRCGDNICYYRNDDDSSGSNSNANEEDEDNSSYTLTFTIEFEHDDDSVYFAHSYPYTYSDLQDYLMEIQRHPVKSKFCKLRLLCRTLAGNNVYYLTVTAPSSNEESMRRKKSIVVSARVHPSETPASWMMKGLMDFITGDTTVAKRLRHKFIFKLVPMLNPDGVIVGNTRNSLTGKDLNRQYRTVIRETYPSIWYTKAMIRRLIEECGVAMYCDMHAHSRKHNIFIYGCENKRNPEKKLTEQVFPLMLHKNSADRFSFESCKFKIQRSKEGTGRIVVWMLGITNSYTIEASFGGSSLGSRKGTHFNTQDYEHMGRAFCETLLDYCDENPNKVKRLSKLFKQIKKIRKREKREQKALKLQKMADQILNLLKQQDRLRSKIIERLMREGSSADEPLNIPLSDYSSDEGNCSSSSDNEGKHSITASDLEGPCCAPTRAPPSSPEVMHEIRKFRMRRMRKVMHELDRIYFTPLFQRKFKALTTLKRQRHKLGCRLPTVKRLRGGGGASQATAETASQAGGGTITMDVNPSPVRSRQGKRPVQKIKSKSHSRSSESSESSNSSQSQTIMNNDNGSRTMPPPSSSMEVKQSMKKRPTTTGGGGVGNGKQRGKKKKYMPIEKNKIITNHKLHIDRNFRLWLANRKIFIFRRKKNRRIRVRSKSSKKRGDLVRTTLDLPTTDPGSDLHFSTDDEEHSPPSGNANYGQVAPLRHTLLQSELQRRYIEEIGDTVVQKPKPAHMPPELIVTTPSKSNSNGTSGKKIDVYKLTPRTAPELEKAHHHSGGVGVSGAQTLTARRTYSWHNLDQEVVRSAKQNNFYETRVPPTASVKAPKVAPPPPRRTVPSNFIPQRHMNSANQADDLQLKLSLKKKIWTGAQGEPDGRPLAWFRSHQSQVQSQVQAHAASAVAQTTSNRSAGGGASAAPPLRTVSGGAAGGGGGGGVMTNGPPPAFIGAPATTATAARKPRKLEQMDLFNACSQKLLQWQQQEDQQQQLPHHQHKKLQQTQQQQQQRLNGGTNVKLDEQLRYKPLPTAAGGHKKSSSVSANKQMPLTSGPPPPQPAQPSHHHHQHHHHHLDKGKRKSNSLIKIAETTQLVTRFARGNRGSAPGGSSNQQQQQQQQRLLYKTPTGTVGGMTAGGGGRMHSAGAGMQPAIGRGGGGGGGLPNKFKTGGLVITAVQQPRNLPGGSRRMRNAAAGIGGGGAGGGIGTTTTTTTLLQYQRSSHSVQMHKSSTGISLDTVNLVRKVKTKLKKRKSRTLTK
ncbi:cytosolic carboxypeptidase Nna1 isoform X1 [Drosophila willistoni]|uniref:cytosolic carboxypeptidase Nna1 isoform X1 n=1 Tax=Drosophila willistoni TaxID=7260 RepID=UPI001F07E80C|nr:cytosolic carboxypeptidase Nna1 isoform X1 [Drosophila willistoni]